jgi:hypothetical protein
MMPRFIALMLLLCACAPASAAVVISSDDTFAQVVSGSSNNTQDLMNTGGTVASANLLGYSSTTTSSFSTVGNSAAFSGSFVHVRSGAHADDSQGAVSAYFTPDVDVSYTASGTYSNSGGFTELNSGLYDYTTYYPTALYYSSQQSAGGPAAFTLGGTAGNYGNYFEGSLTGTLLAGHLYFWGAGAYTQAYPNADLGANAGGSVSLTFSATVVPEFSSVFVWSLLAVTIGGAGWWKRSKLAA